ncbi:vanadium-dependent haloperoxidase [Bradyrhizobium sp. 170]|uniref:vanadium-dependent haloperoxidase n=1 Tax=Bradyrhizobium sp. 170 TaxID=2782641 RepID=UPI001FFFEEA7|nr:vanadium-dependent haloperoxidase [Bradyrhizobium sp. 170]UPK01230.1 vanadium-dependent haloperoxidase [Bradyrhizobium sp. 170]
MHANLLRLSVVVAMMATAPSTFANVITDWDQKALAVVAPMASLGGTSPYMAQRMMGMVHAAMFDAVNSIDRQYRPYVAQLPADPGTSKEAAAAAAAAAVLTTIDAKTADEMKVALATYLASIPDGLAKWSGVRLGEAAAAKIVAARANDGCDAPDVYRPRTTPGVYVPTPITISSMWPDMKPFALTRGSQFRPGPPISLDSKEWATDYNELREYGGQTSAKRTPEQTEIARFWLVGPPVAYHPFVRSLVTAKQMSVVDGARFMALVAIGLNDAIIAVLDAKYHYNFWRPITAIRNGDLDGNPATDREATWQPISNTPMHPEYPCSHCIQSGTVAAVVEAVLGSMDIPETAMTSPTAPGVTRRWTNMTAYTEEVANARIWAGFHYRFSTRVGTEMGLEIGEHVVRNVMQPALTAAPQQQLLPQGMIPAAR